MALIDCMKCLKQVYDKTRASPYCGASVAGKFRFIGESRMKALIILGFSISIALVGCDNGEALNLHDFCTHMSECAVSDSETVYRTCLVRMDSVVIPEGCIDAYVATPCEKLPIELYPDEEYVDICYPPCDFSVDESYCLKDQLYTCQLGMLQVYDCERLCLSLGKSYGGVCGNDANEEFIGCHCA